MLRWKLRPLPVCTVLHHILWQVINLKVGMLLWPKCWQLIKLWCEYTRTPPAPPPPPFWQQNGHVVQHGGNEAWGTRRGCLVARIWMDIWRRKDERVGCGNMTTKAVCEERLKYLYVEKEHKQTHKVVRSREARRSVHQFVFCCPHINQTAIIFIVEFRLISPTVS